MNRLTIFQYKNPLLCPKKCLAYRRIWGMAEAPFKRGGKWERERKGKGVCTLVPMALVSHLLCLRFIFLCIFLSFWWFYCHFLFLAPPQKIISYPKISGSAYVVPSKNKQYQTCWEFIMTGEAGGGCGVVEYRDNCILFNSERNHIGKRKSIAKQFQSTDLVTAL